MQSTEKYICTVSAENKLPREYLTAAYAGVDEEKVEAVLWEDGSYRLYYWQIKETTDMRKKKKRKSLDR